jgi:hypothetical protein
MAYKPPMTFRQVVSEAMRRAGATEDEIRRRCASTDGFFKSQFGDSTLSSIDREVKLKPGVTMDQFINSMVEVFKRFQQLTPEQKEKVAIQSLEEARKNIKRN